MRKYKVIEAFNIASSLENRFIRSNNESNPLTKFVLTDSVFYPKYHAQEQQLLDQALRKVDKDLPRPFISTSQLGKLDHQAKITRQKQQSDYELEFTEQKNKIRDQLLKEHQDKIINAIEYRKLQGLPEDLRNLEGQEVTVSQQAEVSKNVIFLQNDNCSFKRVN